MLQICLRITSYEVKGLVAAKLSWVDPASFAAMESDPHHLYFTKLSGKSRDFYFLVGIHLNNITTLVQIVAWCRPGDKPLSEPMMVRLPTHICVTRPQWVKFKSRKPCSTASPIQWNHHDVIKWKPFPCYWPFVREIHRLSVDSSRKSQWRMALMFTLICAWSNGWANNRDAGDLRQHRAHYDVTLRYLNFHSNHDTHQRE